MPKHGQKWRERIVIGTFTDVDWASTYVCSIKPLILFAEDCDWCHPGYTCTRGVTVAIRYLQTGCLSFFNA